MSFSTDQEQILLGTILGNSSIKPTKEGLCLLMRSKSEQWLHSKVLEISDIEGGFSDGGNYHYWKSKSSDSLTALYNRVYIDGKKHLDMSLLDCLRDIGLAVWYGDCGCLVGRKKRHACLRTQHFSKEANVIVRYFNEVGLPCKLNLVRNKPVIVFTLPGTTAFIDLVGPLLPENRFHLIPARDVD